MTNDKSPTPATMGTCPTCGSYNPKLAYCCIKNRCGICPNPWHLDLKDEPRLKAAKEQLEGIFDSIKLLHTDAFEYQVRMVFGNYVDACIEDIRKQLIEVESVREKELAAPSLNSVDTPAPLPERTTYPIALTETQEAAIELWAADDRLWTTQETVEFNLRTFARKVLSLAAPVPEPEPRHEIASGREFAESEQNKAAKSSAESPAKTGVSTGNGPDTTPENREDELTAPSLRNEPLATKAEPPARKDELGTIKRCDDCLWNNCAGKDGGCGCNCHKVTPVAPQASPEEIIWRGGERWIVNDAKTGYVRLLDLAPKQERRWMKENETEVKAHTVVASPEAPANDDGAGWQVVIDLEALANGWWANVKGESELYIGIRTQAQRLRNYLHERARLGLSGRAE